MNRNDVETHTLDTNTSGAETEIIRVNGYTRCNVVVEGVTGDHDNHVVRVLARPTKNAKFIPIQKTVTGEGFIEFDVLWQAIKIKVKTVEGATSTSKIYVVTTRI